MKRLHPGPAAEGRASGYRRPDCDIGIADCDMGQAGTAGPGADDHIPSFAAHVKDRIRPDSIASISYDCMASIDGS